MDGPPFGHRHLYSLLRQLCPVCGRRLCHRVAHFIDHRCRVRDGWGGHEEGHTVVQLHGRLRRTDVGGCHLFYSVVGSRLDGIAPEYIGGVGFLGDVRLFHLGVAW